MLCLLLQRGTSRASPTWLASSTGAAATAAQRAALARVPLDARRTFLTSPLSLAASKSTGTTATGAKKSVSKLTSMTATGVAKPKKSAAATGTKKKATKVGKPKPPKPKAKAAKPKKVKPKKEEPPKKLRPSERPPKVSSNPWVLFLAKYRLDNDVKIANTAEARETMKVASAAWRSLSDAEKKPYYDQAAAGKAEREKQRAEYYTNMPDELITRLNAQRKKKGKPVVRRHSQRTSGLSGPRISFNFFVADYSSKHYKKTPAPLGGLASYWEILRQGAAVWKGMSESERAPFVEMARKDNERYRREIAAFA